MNLWIPLNIFVQRYIFFALPVKKIIKNNNKNASRAGFSLGFFHKTAHFTPFCIYWFPFRKVIKKYLYFFRGPVLQCRGGQNMSAKKWMLFHWCRFPHVTCWLIDRLTFPLFVQFKYNGYCISVQLLFWNKAFLHSSHSTQNIFNVIYRASRIIPVDPLSCIFKKFPEI